VRKLLALGLTYDPLVIKRLRAVSLTTSMRWKMLPDCCGSWP
jgi:hypothetical protein